MKNQIVEIEAHFFKKDHKISIGNIENLLFDESFENFILPIEERIHSNNNAIINEDKIGFSFRWIGESNYDATAIDYLYMNSSLEDLFRKDYNILCQYANNRKDNELKQSYSINDINVLKYLVVYKYDTIKSFNGEHIEYDESFELIGLFNDVYKTK